MKKRTFFIFLFSLGFNFSAIAATDNLYPRGCTPNATEFKADSLYLGTKPSEQPNRVFVVKNSSYQPLMVTQAANQSALADHFEAVINPNTWSAIITEHDNFEMQCYQINGSQPWQVACNQVVNACELRVAPIMQSARGQYWITKNQLSQRDLFGELRSNGIFP